MNTIVLAITVVIVLISISRIHGIFHGNMYIMCSGACIVLVVDITGSDLCSIYRVCVCIMSSAEIHIHGCSIRIISP